MSATYKVGKPGVLLLAIFLLAASLGWENVKSARADVGAIPIVPPGTTLQTMEETAVEMRAERVRIAVRQASETDAAQFSVHPGEIPYGLDWLPAVADVEAKFWMYNPTSEDITLTAWFPMAGTLDDSGLQGEIGPIQVMVNGKEMITSRVELPNPVSEDLPEIPWATFEVMFPRQQEIEIQVSYLLPPQLEPGDSVGMAFNYIFQTGASWAGPIGQADLTVSLLYPPSPETVGAMPPGASMDGNSLSWTWMNLEPTAEDDFKLRLLLPANWEAIEQGRAAVSADEQSGEAWLALGKAYRKAVHSRGLSLDQDFGEYYLPLTIEAFEKAAELIPENAEAHVGLAEMTLLPIYAERKTDPETLQKIYAELALAESLEEERPPKMGELTVEMVRFFLEFYEQDLQTPTPSSTISPTATRRAATATLTARATQAPSPIATLTPATPAGETIPEQRYSPIIFYGIGFATVGLVILAIYLNRRRER